MTHLKEVVNLLTKQKQEINNLEGMLKNPSSRESEGFPNLTESLD